MTYPKLAALSASLPDPIGPDCTELNREAVECYRELMRAQGEQGWRPIAEAPKDGTRILVTWERGDPWDAELVTWADGNEWADAEGNFYGGEDAPTHWMPLLPAPQNERAK